MNRKRQALVAATAIGVMLAWAIAAALAFGPMDNAIAFLIGLPGCVFAFACALAVHDRLTR